MGGGPRNVPRVRSAHPSARTFRRLRAAGAALRRWGFAALLVGVVDGLILIGFGFWLGSDDREDHVPPAAVTAEDRACQAHDAHVRTLRDGGPTCG